MRIPRRHPLTASLIAALSLLGTQTTDARPTFAGVFEARSNVDRALEPFAPMAVDDTLVVTNCNDAGPGSLRDAMAIATDTSIISLSTLDCSTISLTTGAIIFPRGRITVNGPGHDRLTIDAGGLSRIFEDGTEPYTSIVIGGVTLIGGTAEGNGGCMETVGRIQMADVVVSDCHAHAAGNVSGGAIYAKSQLDAFASMVTASTVASDTAYADGGGIYARSININNGSTIDGNSARSSGTYGVGGGVFAVQSAQIDSSTISNNSADVVGGVAMFSGGSGAATIQSSTISDNRSTTHIGGIFVDAPLNVYSSTIAFNCASGTTTVQGYTAAIGLHARFAPPTLRNTIVADNGFCEQARAADDTAFDLSTHDTAAPVGGDHNLIRASAAAVPDDTLNGDPALGDLADNGGPTKTRALSDNSPAINAGPTANVPSYDQRGLARIVGAAADIGAFELQSVGATHTVSSCADAGDGSLRDTVAHAFSGDIIDLRNVGCSLVTLTTGAIEVPQGNLTVLGPGVSSLTIDGGAHDRVVDHTGFGTLELDNLALTNGYVHSSEKSAGGCVFSASRIVGSGIALTQCNVAGIESACTGGALSASSATLTDANVSGNGCVATGPNMLGVGGGIFVAGDLALTRVTVANNTSSGYNYSNSGGFRTGGTATIDSSTIVGNHSAQAGGGYAKYLDLRNSTVSGNEALVFLGGVFGGSARIVNSTIAFNKTTLDAHAYAAGVVVESRSEIESSIVFGNTLGSSAYDLGGHTAAFFGAHNLVGFSPRLLPPDTLHDDPRLAPLADNGGPTLTHALMTGSPAIDAGDNASGPFDFDQRGAGYARVAGAAADIGSFEVQPASDVLFADGFDRSP